METISLAKQISCHSYDSIIQWNETVKIMLLFNKECLWLVLSCRRSSWKNFSDFIILGIAWLKMRYLWHDITANNLIRSHCHNPSSSYSMSILNFTCLSSVYKCTLRRITTGHSALTHNVKNTFPRNTFFFKYCVPSGFEISWLSKTSYKQCLFLYYSS